MKNIILISMFFSFAFGQFERCNNSGGDSLEGCDFSNENNLEVFLQFAEYHRGRGEIWEDGGGMEQVAGRPRANVRGANFSGTTFAEIGRVVFENIDFAGSNFSGTDLSIVYFKACNLTGVNFSGAILSGDAATSESDANVFSYANFDGARMEGEFSYATMTHTSFNAIDVGDLTFTASNMKGATFTNVRGSSINFEGSFLEEISIINTRDLYNNISISTGYTPYPVSMIRAYFENAVINFPEDGLYDGVITSNIEAPQYGQPKEPWEIQNGVLLNTSLNAATAADSAGVDSVSFADYDFFLVDTNDDGCISIEEFYDYSGKQ